ncbi:MAG: hypothetical protein ABIH21_05080 [Patescibacteria group bacterium]
MSKTPNYDNKIKQILDATQPGERVCELTGEKWEMTQEEIGWFRKFNVPPPRVAPQTRMLCVAAFGNCYQWWYQKHPDTGKQILTYVHPGSGIKVLPDKEWFAKDFSSVNTEVDLGRSAFEIIHDLERRVPFTASRNMEEPENSLSVVSFGDQNCLLTFACQGKNSQFGIVGTNMESSAEIVFADTVTNSYNISYSDRIFNCKFLRNSYDCMNSAFLFDCRNCENCHGAVNRRGGKFLLWDQQVSQAEYEKYESEHDLSCRSVLDVEKKKFHDLVAGAVWPENFSVHAENCIGEYLINCLNLKYAYNCAHGAKDSFWVNFQYQFNEGNAFVDGAKQTSNCYYSLGISNGDQMKFCFGVDRCEDIEYCMQCYNCEHCFGCVGLNRKKFHIFNKAYEESAYWQKLDELKCAMLECGEYGEYFPLSLSSAHFLESTEVFLGFADVETAHKVHANLYDVTAEGAVGNAESADTKQLADVPDCVVDLDDSWSKTPVFDPEIGRRFMFFPQEIAFYRKHNIAPPARHFILRVKDILVESNIGQYESAVCAKCSRSLTVAQNKTFKNRQIYCQECYLQYLEKYG